MKILNIHGYRGNAQNSAYKALEALGFEIISPQIDYDTTPINEVAGQMRDLYKEQQPDFVVGTSLGGFIAATVCAETGCNTILVNPCLLPFLLFDFNTREMVGMFGGFSDIHRSFVRCIVGNDDEVLGDHAFTEKLLGSERVRRIEGGKHSGATLPLKEYFEEIIHN